MEFFKNSNIILLGFCFWAAIAPRFSSSQYSEWFLAYMTALLFCLIGSSEIMMVKPVAFFFTVGGSFAFCFLLARMAMRFVLSNKDI